MEKSAIILFMSNILKFFVKRVSILYAVLIVVCFLINSQRIHMMISLTLGVIFSLLRFGILEAVLRYLGASGKKNLAMLVNLMIYLFSLVIVGVMVVVSMRFGIYTFLATLIGSLSTVIIIMINAITEALGITRNQFGQKVK